MILSKFLHKIGFDIDFATLEKLQNKMNEVDNTIKKVSMVTSVEALRSIGEVLGRISEMTGGLVRFGQESINSSANLETWRLNLQQAAGEGRNLAGVFEDIDKAVRKTNLQKSDVYAYAAQLARTKTPLQDIVPLIEKIGSITGGNPERMSEMIAGMQRAKLVGWNRRTLGAMGPEVFQGLMRNMSPLAFRSIMNSGIISDAEVMAAIDKLAAQRRAYMIEQAGTLTGLFQAFGKSVDEVKERIGNLLVKELHLKDIMKWFIDHIYNLIDWAKKLDPFWKGFIKSSILLTAGLVGLVAVLSGSLGVITNVAMLAMALNALGVSFAGVESAAAPALAAILPWAIGIAGVAAAIYLLWAEIDAWTKGGHSIFGFFLGDFKIWSHDMKEFIDDVATAWMHFTDALATAKWEKVIDDLKFFAKTMKFFLGDEFSGASNVSDMPEWSSQHTPANGNGNVNNLHTQVNVTLSPGTPQEAATAIVDLIGQQIDQRLNYAAQANFVMRR